MVDPKDEAKDQGKKTEDAKKELYGILKQREKEAAAAEKAAADQAFVARRDEKRAEADKKWFGDEKTQADDTVAGRAKRLSQEAGGRGYENYTSAMSQIVELSILMNAAVAADLDTGGKLLRIAEMIGGPVLTVAKIAVTTPFKLAFYPVTTANEILDMLGDLKKRWNNGVTLPDSILKASQCDNDGKLTFNSLAGEMPPGTPAELIEHMEGLNQSMVKEFLATKGYTLDDADDKYKNAAGKVLTDSTFEDLKNNPKDGLKVFASQKHSIELEKNAALTTDKHKDAEEITADKSTHRPFF